VDAENLLVDEAAVVEAVRSAERAAAVVSEVHARLAGCFSRVEPRRSALDYMRGLISGIERRNGWTLSEQAGRATPYALQDLLDRGTWDAEAVRDQVRAFAVERLGDPQAVLVGDETGFLKKGVRSAGTQRQYSGTAGRRENCQIGTFLAYATVRGRTLIDRELYLPQESWIADRARCRSAGIPDEVPFRTKPQQLRLMLERAIAAGVPFAWMTADEAYGQNGELREWCHDQDVHYVMATRCNDRVETPEGHEEVRELVRRVSALGWHRISAGAGAHGQREYDWCRIEIPCPIEDRSRWVLARRALDDGEIAYYLCFGPKNTALKTLVGVAGTRWAVEESFQTSKNECGLDQYQVRKYHAWYRHITLAIAVHIALTVARADEREREKGAAAPELMS
jgi:SRSO17 transposase